MNSFDISWFSVFNGIAEKYFWLDWFIIFVGGSSLILILFVGAFWILWGDSKARDLFRRTFVLLGSIVLSEIFVQTIRFFYNRPRPFEILNISHQLLFHSNGGSFPSSHATIVFAIATVVFLKRPFWGILFFAGAALVAIGRVAGGVHWPTDIIAGAFIGICSTIMMYKLLMPREGVEPS